MGFKVQFLLSPSYIIQGSSTENKGQMSVKNKVGEGIKHATSLSIVWRLMSFLWALIKLFLNCSGVESGRFTNAWKTWSCKPCKMACTVESMGSFILDMSVVAEQKTLSQPATRCMADQSAASSSNAWRSQWHPTKSLISFAKSKACPIWLLSND